MGHNASHHLPLALVLRWLNTGVQVYHQEDIRFPGAIFQGLFHLDNLRIVFRRYVCPNYTPTLLPRHQHKTRHVWEIFFRTRYLSSLLLPTRDGNAAPMLALFLRLSYRRVSALLCVDILHQICLLEDVNAYIALM